MAYVNYPSAYMAYPASRLADDALIRATKIGRVVQYIPHVPPEPTFNADLYMQNTEGSAWVYEPTAGTLTYAGTYPTAPTLGFVVFVHGWEDGVGPSAQIEAGVYICTHEYSVGEPTIVLTREASAGVGAALPAGIAVLVSENGNTYVLSGAVTVGSDPMLWELWT